MIDKLRNVAGWLLFAAVLAHQGHEWWLGHWTIGPSLTPVEIVGPDGRHLDGTEASPFDRDTPPGVYWCFYATGGGCLAWHWRQRRRSRRRRIEAIEAFLEWPTYDDGTRSPG